MAGVENKTLWPKVPLSSLREREIKETFFSSVYLGLWFSLFSS